MSELGLSSAIFNGETPQLFSINGFAPALSSWITASLLLNYTAFISGVSSPYSDNNLSNE
jgi:hypothetical protein